MVKYPDYGNNSDCSAPAPCRSVSDIGIQLI
ncbi:MAG: hypothetical protein ACI9H6_000728, partial [Patiriisocius sp.]